MEKERKTKTRKRFILQIVMWTCILFSVGTCTHYILWVSLHRAKPDNQPKYSSKKNLISRSWRKGIIGRIQIDTSIILMRKENPCPMILFFLTRTMHIHSALILRILQLFFSLPANTEDTIALYLYNHVIDRTPQLRRIEIIFNYEEDLDERASIGHSRKSEYAVRGKKLVKIKNTIWSKIIS